MPDMRTQKIGAISLDYVNAGTRHDDERVLFDAHVRLARAGHSTEFPLRINARLAAPSFAGADGKARVETMGIDTVGMISVHGTGELLFEYAITDLDDCGDKTSYNFFNYEKPDRFGHPGLVRRGPAYHSGFAHHPAYIRQLVLDFAQKRFASEVAKLTARDNVGYDVSALASRIRDEVDSAFDNLFYVVPKNGDGFFVSRSVEPRLILEQLSGSLVLSARHGDFDAASNWRNGLLTFPLTCPAFASEAREAIAASTQMPIEPALDAELHLPGERILLHNVIARADTGNEFAARIDEEFSILKNALRGLSEAIQTFDGAARFEPWTVAAAVAFNTDVDSIAAFPGDPRWEAALDTFADAVLDDPAYEEFLVSTGWNLAVSPFMLAQIKHNALAGRNPTHRIRMANVASANPAHGA